MNNNNHITKEIVQKYSMQHPQAIPFPFSIKPSIL